MANPHLQKCSGLNKNSQAMHSWQKFHLGGGKKVCLGVVYGAAKYYVKAGEDWIVPASLGAYPIFAAGGIDDKKKIAVSQFMIDEHDILVVEAMENLLKNQLLELIDEDYILELKEGLSEYSSVTLVEILTHLRDEYAPMDGVIYMELLAQFREPPDFDAPIDKYLRKQQ